LAASVVIVIFDEPLGSDMDLTADGTSVIAGSLKYSCKWSCHNILVVEKQASGRQSAENSRKYKVPRGKTGSASKKSEIGGFSKSKYSYC